MALTEKQLIEAEGSVTGLQIYGNNDEKISPYLKAWIAQPDKEGNISSCVVGLIGPGTARSIQANWNSPFEQSNLGGMFEKIGGLGQAATGGTSVTTFSSTQVWEGNRPHSFNLTLLFYAISNAYKEVMAPLRELDRMMAPDIKDGNVDDAKGFWATTREIAKSSMPGGRIPLPVVLNIGRRMMIPHCVIESMMVPLDKERTKDGYLVRAEATLSIATKVMLNRDDVGKTWPKG